MNTRDEILTRFPAPISPDWTIEALLEWFAADDERLSDARLRHPMRVVEEALTGSRWTLDRTASADVARLVREPALVMLVRSVAQHVAQHPAARARTIDETISGVALRGDARGQTAAAAASSSVVATS